MVENPQTILLVDDQDIILDVTAQMLKQFGYDLLIARSGIEAIDVYQAHQAQIDLVILDMVMPDMNGGQTYDHLQAIDPDIRVLLSSGYSLDDQASAILDRGCNGFIQKPFDLNGLSQKIRDVLD